MAVRTAPFRFNLGRFVVFATLTFFVCFYGIPLLWLFLAGTLSEVSLFSDPPFALGSWEALSRTWNNLTSYNNFQMVTWAANSLVYSVGGVVLSLIASIPGGYALAASEFPGRKLILVLTLIAMITPSTAVVLPIFLEMNLLGLNNTYAGLILASGFFPFGVYLTYVYFSTSLPKGVMDSARVDGCTRFQTLTLVYLPLALPSLVAVVLFTFLTSWNEFLLALMFTQTTASQTMPVVIASFASDFTISFSFINAAAVVAVIPPVIIAIMFERYIVSGLTAGAVKG